MDATSLGPNRLRGISGANIPQHTLEAGAKFSIEAALAFFTYILYPFMIVEDYREWKEVKSLIFFTFLFVLVTFLLLVLIQSKMRNIVFYTTAALAALDIYLIGYLRNIYDSIYDNFVYLNNPFFNDFRLSYCIYILFYLAIEILVPILLDKILPQRNGARGNG